MNIPRQANDAEYETLMPGHPGRPNSKVRLVFNQGEITCPTHL
jgi:hypothetical protein